MRVLEIAHISAKRLSDFANECHPSHASGEEVSFVLTLGYQKIPRLCSVGFVQNIRDRGKYPRCYPTKNFCKFCRTFIPIPGTSVCAVRPCHNTRNFWKLCNMFIPVPETSGSYVRLPYPYPESTQPTEHNLGISSHCVNSRTLLFLRLRRWKNVFLRVFGDGIRLRKQRLAQGKLSA